MIFDVKCMHVLARLISALNWLLSVLLTQRPTFSSHVLASYVLARARAYTIGTGSAPLMAPVDVPTRISSSHGRVACERALVACITCPIDHRRHHRSCTNVFFNCIDRCTRVSGSSGCNPASWRRGSRRSGSIACARLSCTGPIRCGCAAAAGYCAQHPQGIFVGFAQGPYHCRGR